MKHDFKARKARKEPSDWPLLEDSPAELGIQRLSRFAGPVALTAGYLATYVAWRYVFT